jgi:hypothetical protein
MSAVWTHEQKGGINDLSLGHNFYIHIIADMTQATKGQVARDCRSTVSKHKLTTFVKADPIRTNTDFDKCMGYIVE